MRLFPALILISLILSCGDPPATPLTDRANTAALVAKLQAARDRAETLEGTAAQLRREMEALEAENEAMKQQMEAAELATVDHKALQRAREEAQLYKEGLERAVEELNRRPGPTRDGEDREPEVRPARSRVYLRQPRSVITSLDVVTEGTIHNAGSEVATGFLELILWIDGERDGSTTLSLEIPPQTVENYDWTFRNVIATGQNARVEAKWGDYRSSQDF